MLNLLFSGKVVLNSPKLLICLLLCHSIDCGILDFEVVALGAYMFVRDVAFCYTVAFTDIQI